MSGIDPCRNLKRSNRRSQNECGWSRVSANSGEGGKNSRANYGEQRENFTQ